jgi:hypothetical protein
MLQRHDGVVRRFAGACQRGDVAAIRVTLHADAIAVCDSGGLVPAPMGPTRGADDVARLAAVLLCGQPDTELTIEAVNGRAGLALRRAGRAVAVVAFTAVDAAVDIKVAVLWIVLNPAKLGGWQRR